ncbi:hypothetical protein P3X46_007479 [Hevea brasiliensis]|uniref:PORR domain-containing protein n=1 Tax=Hevea brasiliensis TaxID=3981 RepID=A0ABQ9MU61_HEVBR|nr:protein WHAT'S THIS FACTOR 1 homolog, chloroplastic-like [Hevea brasiliensis]XP_058001857.1 protein WHAT'S THIS FACTOR 1 homolog, chloroplastic-like [Hevea brasiliensis]XP_058001858.1 protein WHAT'S THIS FACTOR 1 homolog, chloroplastic-like [Hevea brasiliensis]XP_058001859.1 protein WHAT'S THIS FACTOR 1 homolog, chloroplastic-like [Hevea brasiliensis]XP_058001860.1 protein WHAT'S THIS FACTOR 1 homolog, chloroplastic-like [Hevea brasiliensis]XP_058001861.1 protein WHAT'S THIS FACTOR 1 homolo
MVTQIVKAEALMNGFDKANLFAFLPMRTKWYGKPLLGWMQSRFMTTSKRVQDRSSKKRVHDLEIVTEKWKIVSKVMAVMEVLKQEVEMVIPLRNLEQYRNRINLPKPHKISDFLSKSPKLFELYKDQRGVLWCGMTKEAEDLLEEQERLIEEHSDKAAEYVTRCLMMSVDKQLRVDKIAHFRRDFGLPMDFRTKWVHKYSKLFRVVKSGGGEEYLKLVSWKPAWEITELEKRILGATEISVHEPGLLSLPFPLKFPPNYKKLVYRYGGKIDHFQKRSYISPYADARGLTAGSLEFDKRAVAIMHELLSFTIEKRLVTDHLTHFRREFVMPQKLMRLLLKHFGIFYVSERGKRFSVFLNEAYEGQELIEKGALVVWKEKLLSLVGYRGKKKKIETSSDLSDIEYDNFIDNDSEKECMSMQLECEETMGDIEGALLVDNDEMEVGELGSAYKDSDTS